jgi:hypothetical protein
MSLSTVIPIPFNDRRRAIDTGEEIAEVVERVTRSGRYLLGEETAYEPEDYIRDYNDLLALRTKRSEAL